MILDKYGKIWEVYLGATGIEPAWIAPKEPKSFASANFATRPANSRISRLLIPKSRQPCSPQDAENMFYPQPAPMPIGDERRVFEVFRISPENSRLSVCSM